MSVRLDSKPQIHTLASDLGLRHTSKPCHEILRSVEARVRAISKRFKCKTLNELLFAIANEIGTVFKEIHFEHDLQSLRDEYVQKGELIFANLENELGRPDDYGITIGIHP